MQPLEAIITNLLVMPAKHRINTYHYSTFLLSPLPIFDFLRKGLNGYFTGLDFPQSEVDQANALKSRIVSVSGDFKYKDISVLVDEELK
jgi:hypothetical protein